MKKIKFLRDLLKRKEFMTKIYIYPSTKSAGDGFDSYEENYTYSNLNPLIIKGYVSQLSPTSLVWKGYGLEEQGAVEVLCEKRYKNYFKIANKIKINDEEYQVFKEASGGHSIISDRPYNIIRVILQRKR